MFCNYRVLILAACWAWEPNVAAGGWAVAAPHVSRSSLIDSGLLACGGPVWIAHRGQGRRQVLTSKNLEERPEGRRLNFSEPCRHGEDYLIKIGTKEVGNSNCQACQTTAPATCQLIRYARKARPE